MNRRDAPDLLLLVERFIDGSERSPRLAAEIEGLAIECCQNEPWFDDASEALALFMPGGDGHYIDEQALVSELCPVARALRAGSDVKLP